MLRHRLSPLRAGKEEGDRVLVWWLCKLTTLKSGLVYCQNSVFFLAGDPKGGIDSTETFFYKKGVLLNEILLLTNEIQP